jgi:hypothetical protein
MAFPKLHWFGYNMGCAHFACGLYGHHLHNRAMAAVNWEILHALTLKS